MLIQGAKKDTKATSKAPAKTPKKKEGGGGGKAKKKKWSKGKTRDKLNNLVLFDKATYDKLLKEVPTYKLITPSIVSERLKVRGSLARKALIELEKQGRNLSESITQVVVVSVSALNFFLKKKYSKKEFRHSFGIFYPQI